jgi:hypothetical protein
MQDICRGCMYVEDIYAGHIDIGSAQQCALKCLVELASTHTHTQHTHTHTHTHTYHSILRASSWLNCATSSCA